MGLAVILGRQQLIKKGKRKEAHDINLFSDARGRSLFQSSRRFARSGPDGPHFMGKLRETDIKRKYCSIFFPVAKCSKLQCLEPTASALFTSSCSCKYYCVANGNGVTCHYVWRCLNTRERRRGARSTKLFTSYIFFWCLARDRKEKKYWYTTRC